MKIYMMLLFILSFTTTITAEMWQSALFGGRCRVEWTSPTKETCEVTCTFAQGGHCLCTTQFYSQCMCTDAEGNVQTFPINKNPCA